MTAEIITIGDELLIGQITDSNAAFLGKELTKIGVEVLQVKTIKDEKPAILSALKSASKRVDLVVVTGGLGPTNDDVTKQAFLTYFDDKLQSDPAVLQHIKNLFSRIEEPLLAANRSQAEVPSAATILPNKYGTAPGMWFEREDVVYVSLPGVPYEMKALMTDAVLPRLKSAFELPVILQKTVLTYGVGESRLADKIKDWEAHLSPQISLAYLPSPGCVKLRLTLRGTDEKYLKKQLDAALKDLQQIIGSIIGGYEGEASLPQELAGAFTAQKKTLALAESCTGGRIAALFTTLPGASAYFKGGVIPYFTGLKVDLLGISPSLIEKHSVVSAEVAKAMAIQVRRKLKADYGVATTGNAGPTKGDSEAAIGTVFIAVAREEEVAVKAFHFGNHREKNLQKTVYKVLEELKKSLLEDGMGR